MMRCLSGLSTGEHTSPNCVHKALSNYPPCPMGAPPAGKRNYSWLPYHDPGKALAHGVRVQFASRDCTPCPLRARCTKRKTTPRELLLQIREEYEALQVAKQRQLTQAFQEQYALRAGVEAAHAQGMRRSDLRRTRYIGLAKTRLQHIFTAIALTIVRAIE